MTSIFIRQPPFPINPHCLKAVSEVALLHRFHCTNSRRPKYARTSALFGRVTFSKVLYIVYMCDSKCPWAQLGLGIHSSHTGPLAFMFTGKFKGKRKVSEECVEMKNLDESCILM